MSRTATADKITDKLVKAGMDRIDAEDLITELSEALYEAGRQDGKDDLLIDLWDGKEITAEGVEFAVENNGCTDPRR